MWDTNLMTSSVKTFKQHICLDFELRLKVTRQSPPALTFRSFWHAQEALQSYFLPYRVTHKVYFQTRLKLILFCACGQLCPSLRQRNLNHIVLKMKSKVGCKISSGVCLCKFIPLCPTVTSHVVFSSHDNSNVKLRLKL